MMKTLSPDGVIFSSSRWRNQYDRLEQLQAIQQQPGNELDKVLRRLPVLSLQGKAFRIVRPQHLSSLSSLVQSLSSLKYGGRYNLARKFEALYLTNSPETAYQVVHDCSNINKFIRLPRTFLVFEYKLNAVLDMTDSSVQSALNTNLQELTENRVALNDPDLVLPTQQIGNAVYRSGRFEALKVPSTSSKDFNAYDLVIFIHKLSPNSLLKYMDESSSFRPLNTKVKDIHIGFPPECVLGSEVNLKIELALSIPQMKRLLQEVSSTIGASIDPVRFDLCITAPGFDVEQWHKPMILPRSRNLEEISFGLIPRELGQQVIEIEFFHQSSRLGYFLVKTKVK